METQTSQEYFRSVSSESSSYMMASANNRRDAPSKLCVAMVVIVVVVLQIASTTGLFVYLNMSISQVKTQGVTEELRCLGLLNALDKDQEIPPNLAQLFGEPCIKLAEGIKAYISKVTENIVSKYTFQEAQAQPRINHVSTSATSPRPSAHLTLRDSGLQVFAPQPDLHQSCRHPLRSWGNHSFGAHLHNMSLWNGRLRVPREGRYYLYSQVYFRYPSPGQGDQSSHQLVQCVYKKTSYARPIQLLKGVGTKCWAPDAEYALHSVYQGGLFQLQAGDEVFISVSSPSAVHADDSSSYFGAFRLDL
ncbi:tumor necrosis factor ligand superfamily member 10-like [Conger conger]|uniref:tumor necrosis factor ligand superfamily member 10-like n=1 Tax=Conger conger TaxID=82655 RepID=UPI002A59F551|nr:tumor necrosis factor ligand superfamily member 10-like [Conger conger]